VVNLIVKRDFFRFLKQAQRLFTILRKYYVYCPGGRFMFEEDSTEFINNSSIGIHAVSAEGIIEYANQCELETLGYTKEEYVGHHVSEFKMDGEVLNDMMCKLGNLETLNNYPYRIQGKECIKYFLYNSSVYIKDGEFIHTRCFTSEIEKTIYDVFYKLLNTRK
jgi:PAS domain S-box-containing protein